MPEYILIKQGRGTPQVLLRVVLLQALCPGLGTRKQRTTPPPRAKLPLSRTQVSFSWRLLQPHPISSHLQHLPMEWAVPVQASLSPQTQFIFLTNSQVKKKLNTRHGVAHL